MKTVLLAVSALSAACLAATPAKANEIFGGIYVHDVDTFVTIAGEEDGLDVHLGWRGDRIGKTPLQPYVFAALNTGGHTHYAAAGLSAKFGDEIYFRPGVGLAVHTGSAADFQDSSNDHLEFGSRVLFEPEVNIGARINDRMTLEASWVHMSNGQIFDRDQNPGIDNFGLRLSVQLP